MYSASNILTKRRGNRILPENNRNYYRNVYLKSDHWKFLREEKLAKTSSCEKCGTKSLLDVHHKNYRELYDVKLTDLQTLCRLCHDKEHLKKQKSKKPIRDKRLNRATKIKNADPKLVKKILNEIRRKKREKENRHRPLSARNRERQEKFNRNLIYEQHCMSNYISIHY